MATGRSTVLLIGAGVVIVAAGAALLATLGLGWGWGADRVEGLTCEDRVRSIGHLADRHPSGAAQALADAVTKERDPEVRQAALVGLARFATPDARTAVDQGTHDTSARVRAAAAATLGMYRDEVAVNRLGEMVLGDPDPEARLGAVTGLGRHRSAKALVFLMDAAEKDMAVEVPTAALAQLYYKLGMRSTGTQGQADDRRTAILRVVENLKDDVIVEEAYRRAGRPIVRNPAYYVPPLTEPDPRAQQR
jgi:hypothetical protein